MILWEKALNSDAWKLVMITRRNASSARDGISGSATPWGLYNKIGEGTSCRSSVTIRSTEMASSRWRC